MSLSEDAKFVRAKFKIENGPNAGEFEVHFNPMSLSYTIANSQAQQGGGGGASGGASGGAAEAGQQTQFQVQSTGKLTMDLVFDTTHSGEDVRVYTKKVSKTMEPVANNAPPTVVFSWGTYSLRGSVEGYKETIDFFSPEGVPLRAAVNLTVSSNEKVFDPEIAKEKGIQFGTLAAEPVQVPAGAGGAAAVARALGKPGLARAIAAANGMESVRFSAGGSLSVGGSVGMKASFGGSFGASARGGASLGGAISVRGGAGPVPSAFEGLRATSRASVSIDPTPLLRRPESQTVAADRNATFSVGGRAQIEGPASLKADVGATASLRGRIRFGGEG